MRRGEVNDARLDPTEGAEQAGSRPVVIVSRDAINTASSAVVAVPFTTHRPGKRVYPSHALIRAPEGSLQTDSVALCEQVQVLSKTRLGGRRGAVTAEAIGQIGRGLVIALDLPLHLLPPGRRRAQLPS